MYMYLARDDREIYVSIDICTCVMYYLYIDIILIVVTSHPIIGRALPDADKHRRTLKGF